MTDYYTKFSFVLKFRSQEEQDWAKRHLHLFEEAMEKDEFDLDFEEEYEKLNKIYFDDDLADEPTIDFDWFFRDNELIIYSEEAGRTEHVAKFLQQYLKQFGGDYLSFSWAETCNAFWNQSFGDYETSAGIFGGGAAFITADNIEYMQSYCWLEEMLEKFKADKSN